MSAVSTSLLLFLNLLTPAQAAQPVPLADGRIEIAAGESRQRYLDLAPASCSCSTWRSTAAASACAPPRPTARRYARRSWPDASRSACRPASARPAPDLQRRRRHRTDPDPTQRLTRRPRRLIRRRRRARPCNACRRSLRKAPRRAEGVLEAGGEAGHAAGGAAGCRTCAGHLPLAPAASRRRAPAVADPGGQHPPLRGPGRQRRALPEPAAAPRRAGFLPAQRRPAGPATGRSRHLAPGVAGGGAAGPAEPYAVAQQRALPRAEQASLVQLGGAPAETWDQPRKDVPRGRWSASAIAARPWPASAS